jgi:hydroxymethylglutaryl-CoA lyase
MKTIGAIARISNRICKKVFITDVTLRDGLQSYQKIISPYNRFEIGKKLISLGLNNIEVGSIVSDKVIPQMRNSMDVYNEMKQYNNMINYHMLISNMKGIKLMMDNNVKHIAFFTSPSDGFNLKNINKTTEDSLNTINMMMKEVNNSAYIKGYISCINECPYEGRLELAKIINTINKLDEMGMDEICISDTLGTLTRDKLNEILYNLSYEVLDKISIHLHQKANENWKKLVDCCLFYNIISFDTSLLNLGGCPAAYKSTEKSGNLSLYDLVYHLENNGYDHGIATNKIKEVENEIQLILDRS